MGKIILFFLVCITNWAQTLHHQAIAVQGASVKIDKSLFILQSVGQMSVIGNSKAGALFIGQGFIQSRTVAKAPIEEGSVIVAPNPVVDFTTFTFSTQVPSAAKIQLFDSRGRLVFSDLVHIENKILTIDLSQLAEGIYIAKLETQNQSFSTKLIKSK